MWVGAMCTFHLNLQMSVTHGQELQMQLQISYVTSGKKLAIGGIFVMLHLQVTLNFNSDISDNTWCVWLHFYVFGVCLAPIIKCIYPLKASYPCNKAKNSEWCKQKTELQTREAEKEAACFIKLFKLDRQWNDLWKLEILYEIKEKRA
jgi:hypothetical protein